MQIKVASSSASEVKDAVVDVRAQLSQAPSLLVVGFNTELNAKTLVEELNKAFECPVLGGSSCKGSLMVDATHAVAFSKLAVLAIYDEQGNYGVGQQTIMHCARIAGQAALEMALYASGRAYESPALIWCVLPPGQEEQVLEGFSDVVGENIPVFGGSSADNDVSGAWQQISNLDSGAQQISVAVFYPSTRVSATYSSGYEPTSMALQVTQARGRELISLDGVAAAQRYNEVTGGLIESQIGGGSVLGSTTLCPLGRKVSSYDGIDNYILSHPEAVTAEGSLTVFSDVNVGESLYLMSGSREGLLKRAQRVVATAIQLLPADATPAGVLMIYCAGCMLTVENDISSMAENLQSEFPTIPILGFYTFGEQGCFLDGKSRHGNLMISAVAFCQ